MSYQFKVGDTGKTRDGRPYRVLATDLKGSYPVAAAVEYGIYEESFRFTTTGKFNDQDKDHLLDLLPPTRTITVERWLVYHENNGNVGVNISESEEYARFWSDSLPGHCNHLRTVKITETFELPQGVSE